jgi:hypothetical protein
VTTVGFGVGEGTTNAGWQAVGPAPSGGARRADSDEPRERACDDGGWDRIAERPSSCKIVITGARIPTHHILCLETRAREWGRDGTGQPRTGASTSTRPRRRMPPPLSGRSRSKLGLGRPARRSPAVTSSRAREAPPDLPLKPSEEAQNKETQLG